MKKEKLEYMMKHTLEDAKTLLLKDGGLMPVAFVKHGNNIDITPLSFEDSDKKDQQLHFLRNIVKKKNADAIFIVTESWYVIADNGHIVSEPSKHPMRKECIMIIGECEDCSMSIIQTFDRKDGKIIFGENVDIEETVTTKFNFGIENRKRQNKNLRNLN